MEHGRRREKRDNWSEKYLKAGWELFKTGEKQKATDSRISQNPNNMNTNKKTWQKNHRKTIEKHRQSKNLKKKQEKKESLLTS